MRVIASPGAAPTTSWSHIRGRRRSRGRCRPTLDPEPFDLPLELGDAVLEHPHAVQVDPTEEESGLSLSIGELLDEVVDTLRERHRPDVGRSARRARDQNDVSGAGAGRRARRRPGRQVGSSAERLRARSVSTSGSSMSVPSTVSTTASNCRSSSPARQLGDLAGGPSGGQFGPHLVERDGDWSTVVADAVRAGLHRVARLVADSGVVRLHRRTVSEPVAVRSPDVRTSAPACP